ncbi:Protein of unknown function DUF115 [Sphingobium faniae]|nr:Protein of unknown function DUF115 [Sphingobium faniae]
MPISIHDERKNRIARFNFPVDLQQKILGTDRCFILGMGPSINKLDPEQLKNELCIGVNFIYRTEFRPDILCIVDRQRVDTNNFDKAKKIIALEHVLREKNHLFRDVDHTKFDFSIKYHMPFNKSWFNVSDFDKNLETVYFGGSVITDLTIPLAIYLGIKEIFVAGLDGFDAFPNSHAGNASQILDALPPTEYLRYQQKIKSLARANNTKIYNISAGCLSGGFDKVNPKDFSISAILRSYKNEIKGNFFALGRDICSCERPYPDKSIYHLKRLTDNFYARHKKGLIFFEKIDDNSPKEDFLWEIEPSFCNKNWVSFKSYNVPTHYITSIDHLSNFRLNRFEGIYNTYFSSFQPYVHRQHAEERAEKNAMLIDIEKMKQMVGHQLNYADTRP